MKQIPFRPKIEGVFKDRFYKSVSSIDLTTPSREVISIIDGEINWVENECFYNLEQRKRYRGVLYFLRDLISASYRAEYKDGVLLLSLPSVSKNDIQNNTTSEVKALLRGWMAESRHERILSGKEFVLRMERGTAIKKPITDLIADGKELSDRLMRFKKGELKIEETIDPKLELVEENKKDIGFSEIKLSEIWQYFRLTWSTAYETTPGRTIRYLIRDYAHPMHAVMGIASLENCTVQISTRDDYLGWTVTGFTKRIEKMDEEGKRFSFNKLLDNIRDGIASIDYLELCSDEVIDHPTLEDVESLENIAINTELKRKEYLKATDDDFEKSDLGKISKDAELALYKKKRAEQLAKLLRAKLYIEDFLSNDSIDGKSDAFCRSDNGASAIFSALVAQKSKHIGSSMMELNVCGAIPPYNHVLGGKLVALLATSPQVIHDYKERYFGKTSEIASRMKGSPVVRPADLVYLGTTSLYYVGSSQYNRLRIPGSVFDSDFDLNWKELGTTVGYGTMHISRKTTMILNDSVGDDAKLINHVFGEGASPKFRLMTMGVSKLLESSPDSDPKEFTKHAMSRIVYGVCLAKNTKEYLLGYDDKPEYYTDVDNYEEGTQKIVDFWRNRWLKSRLNYEPIFERMQEFDKNQLRISNEFSEDETSGYTELKEAVPMPTSKEKKLDFVRNFYRGSSAFAENIPDDLLKIIHVGTSLDESIVDDLKNNKDVVLTGNAGDGKTHIIKILLPVFKSEGINPTIMLDASEKSSMEIYDRWHQSRIDGKPFLVAINAAVLYKLNEYCDANNLDFTPVRESFDLMQNAIYYHDNDRNYPDVVVYDLNQRNILAASFVKEAIIKLTSDELYERCTSCQFKEACSVPKNRILLNSPMFMERLCFVLNRISLQGYHATLRDLQALISYMIFGNKKCAELSSMAGGGSSDVISLLFDENAKGEIFKKIHKSFDPVKISHPVYDELILTNNIDKSTWCDEFEAPFNSIESTDNASFMKRKREFFFLNKDGDKYIDVNDDVASMFERFLSNPNDKQMKKQIIKKLNCFFETPQGNDLVIWTGHRFDNQARKILISVGSLPDSRFSIGRPQLQSDMKRGFESVSNYVRFESKISSTDNLFLKIDYGMYELLTQAENGVPVLFIESDLVKKVWRFIEQLQSMKNTNDETRYDYTILDVHTKEKVQITIDCEDNQYSNLVIEHREGER